jgi:hypothetical protein
VVNTFGLTAVQLMALPLLCCAAACLQPPPQAPSDAPGVVAPGSLRRRTRASLTGTMLIASTMRFAALGVCIVSAAWQQRHILLWAIFAPKLVFEVALMAVADGALLLAAGVWQGLAG